MDEIQSKRELWADPPREPTPAVLDDVFRTQAQKVKSDLRRKQ